MKILKIPGAIKFIIQYERYLGKIKKYYKEKDHLKSIEWCNRLVEFDQDSYFGYYYKGMNSLQLKLYSDSRDYFELAEKKLFKNRYQKHLKEYFQNLKLRISQSYYKELNYKEALQEIDKAIRQYPDFVDGYIYRIEIKEAAEDYDGALDDINLALKIKPDDKELISYKNHLVYNYIEDKKVKEKEASG